MLVDKTYSYTDQNTCQSGAGLAESPTSWRSERSFGRWENRPAIEL